MIHLTMKLEYWSRSNKCGENVFRLNTGSYPYLEREGWKRLISNYKHYEYVFLPGQKLEEDGAPTVHITVPDDDEVQAFYDAACAGGPIKGKLFDSDVEILEQGQLSVKCCDYDSTYYMGDDYALEHALFFEAHPIPPKKIVDPIKSARAKQSHVKIKEIRDFAKTNNLSYADAKLAMVLEYSI